MRRRAKTRVLHLAVLGVAACPAAALAQTTINGNVMALQSSGAAAGAGWTLNSNGYVGTYITLTAPGTVTLSASATGTLSNGLNPDLTFSIADSNQSFTVTPGTNSYTYSTPVMPAGTYFVRTQLDDQTATATPALTVGSLTVSGANVSVLNSNSTTNALNAATTYASNFRAGTATIAMTNGNGVHLGAGTSVQVKLIDNSFNFAAAVYGNSVNANDDQWINVGPTGQNLPPVTSEQINYQKALLANFNMIVPANAGKWQNDEFTQNSVDMRLVDAETQFAVQNGLSVRMHNVIWNSQQPTFVNNLFSGTTSGTLTAANKATLNTDISNRINNYYLKQNNVGLGTPRADSYTEIDVLNEAWHGQSAQDNYIGANSLGVSGVASVYAQVAAAAAAVGSNARLYTNEYNVLQFSPASISSTGVATGSDPYANWYFNDIQQLQRAGGPVSGIGMELYTNASNNVSAVQMEEALQNMSVAKDPNGNPIDLSLTEFGASITGPGGPTSANYDADLLTALTMMYGTPQATTFGYWGGVGGSHYVISGAVADYALYDANYNLTPAGQTYENWMNQYNTNLTLTTDANGNITFDGTYGMYDVTVGGQTYELDLEKGTTNYGLMTPIGGVTWNGAGINGNFSTSANWSPALAPNAPLTFAGTNNLTVNNDSTPGAEYEGLTFNSTAGPFVLTGNSINLGGDITNNSANVQTINTPLALQTNVNLNAASADLSLGGNISGAFALTKTGPHSVTLGGVNTYTGATTVGTGALVISAPGALSPNSTVTLAANTSLILATGSGLQTPGALNLAPTSTVDIGANALAINFAGKSDPAPAFLAALTTGYNAGLWTGVGITSTAAALNPGMFALGYADGNADTIAAVSPNEFVIEYTLAGDADLDGAVGFSDLVSLAQNFGFTGKDWTQGNFTYDPTGSVGFADLVLLAQNFGDSITVASTGGALGLSPAWQSLTATATVAVPEPTSLALMLTTCGLLARRRRRDIV